MNETVTHINTLYTILTLMFACGVSYATIKVSLKSMTEQVKKLEQRVERLDQKIQELEINRQITAQRFDQIEKALEKIDEKLSKIYDFYISLEKRGAQRWQQEPEQSR